MGVNNGVIIQWGSYTGRIFTVTLPISYTTSYIVTSLYKDVETRSDPMGMYNFGAWDITKSNFVIRCSATLILTKMIMTIGH